MQTVNRYLTADDLKSLINTYNIKVGTLGLSIKDATNLMIKRKYFTDLQDAFKFLETLMEDLEKIE